LAKTAFRTFALIANYRDLTAEADDEFRIADYAEVAPDPFK
jgi:hypothetical protein